MTWWDQAATSSISPINFVTTVLPNKPASQEVTVSNRLESDTVKNFVPPPTSSVGISAISASVSSEKSRITTSKLCKQLAADFDLDKIHSYLGDVCISMNPMKNLGKAQQPSNVENGKDSPHLYELATNAKRDMLFQQQSQCIILMGQSGSGKTESSKRLLRFLASTKVSETKDPLVQKLDAAMQVLDVFGSAPTDIHKNSSRFNRICKVSFDQSGTPIGATINVYGLELSRLSTLPKIGSHPFKVFNLLIDACISYPSLQLISRPSHYSIFINESSLMSPPATPDQSPITQKSELAYLQDKMINVLGWNKSDVECCWYILAGILHLGNVKIALEKRPKLPSKSSSRGSFESSQTLLSQTGSFSSSTSTQSAAPPQSHHLYVQNPESVAFAAILLGIPQDQLEDALLMRKVIRRKSKGDDDNGQDDMVWFDNVQNAMAARDSFIRGVYARLWNYIVANINWTLNQKVPTSNLSVSVIDFVGHENLTKNTFQQFCVNYSNEELYSLFAHLHLISPHEDCLMQGVPGSDINLDPFTELKSRLNAISSVFHELDDPHHSSDREFLHSLIDKKVSTDHVNVILSNWSSNMGMQIKHFGGFQVTYKVDGWVESNKKPSNEREMQRENAMDSSSHRTLRRESKAIGLTKTPQTLSEEFLHSLASIFEYVQQTRIHFVCCLSPLSRVPEKISSKIIVDTKHLAQQIKSFGLAEIATFKSLAFGVSVDIQKFATRFGILLKGHNTLEKDHREIVAQICTVNGIMDYAIGKTKVFLRDHSVLRQLEQQRAQHAPWAALTIQRVWKGWKARVQYIKKRAVLKIMMAMIRFQARLLLRDMLRRVQDWTSKWVFKPLHLARVPFRHLCHLAELLKRLHINWQLQRIKAMPLERLNLVRQKIIAYDTFNGSPKRWSLSDPWQGIYFGQDSINFARFIDKVLRPLDDPRNPTAPIKVEYTRWVTKVNRKGWSDKRGLVITSRSLYIINDLTKHPTNGGPDSMNHPAVFRLAKRTGRSLKDTKDILVGNVAADGVVCIRFSDGKGDLVIDLGAGGVVEGVCRLLWLANEQKRIINKRTDAHQMVMIEQRDHIDWVNFDGKPWTIQFVKGLEGQTQNVVFVPSGSRSVVANY